MRLLASGVYLLAAALLCCLGAHWLVLGSWRGEADTEEGLDQDGIVRVKVNPKYYRPTEASDLVMLMCC